MITRLKTLWQQYQEQKEEKEIIQIIKTKTTKAFHSAQLFLVQKDKFTDLKVHIYPEIRNIKLMNHAEIVFTIPRGMNPEDIKKKEYVFKQYLSDRAELDVGTLTTVIRIFPDEIQNVLYDYDAFPIKNEKLPVVCGVNKFNQYTIYDMVEHPHLLIAGTTGSGKSTQIRAILATLIRHKTPEQLHLYLCDLKKSEFHLFQKVQHVKSTTYTADSLYPVLVKLKKELERRGEILNQHGYSHIDQLPKKLPYLVMCIDEYPLLQHKKAITDIVEEISSTGRTNGIFLILSMQRPDSKVIDGKIKNNLNVTMGFRCKNAINARVMDCPGAEKIPKTAKGRMILNFDALETIQAPFLSEDKTKLILKNYKNIQDEDCHNAENTITENESIFGILEDE
ncbi:FtsK/SpoIIIE domain-containing protein [Bacillus cereus]|uniref:FtsK/SpoIIIE domain-containing protein n=1 Tax=Bacillus cereus group TaxID=86661 RepID=UPI002404CE87|nr:FtsK/SpoIIIE domain-containing protein [Bacillus cereus]MDF9530623.1 FtsK/SpoIIIE domain-containing protein [Bacillus cereus]MDG1578897.1 FtsK/SpoIIIE domain-containing protein [Bacillus cereus]